MECRQSFSSTYIHGCICEILTGGSEFGTHTDQTWKGIRCPLGRGVLRQEYLVKFVAVTTEYTAV